MEKIIKKVLLNIEKNGYEAYLVGGYVRDFMLGKKTYDIDICTNALPKDIKSIFPQGEVGNYGTVTFKIKQFDFEITTYRVESKYEKRHPKEVTYVSNLLEDLNRRDFKINTLCMNTSEMTIDLLGGLDDIKNKEINVVGDALIKFTEDPLRILRAIRFSTLLDFSLSNDISNAIKKTYKLIGELSKQRIRNELDKILMSSNYKKGLNLIKEYGIDKVIEISFDVVKPSCDLCGMWSQIETDETYPFTKEEKNNIIKIKEITKKGIIDKECLFNNGLYLCTVAGEILGISKKEINQKYKKMPIYSAKDICVSTNNIISYLNISDGKQIRIILDDLCTNILTAQIKNTKKEVYKYLNKYKEE